MGDKDNIFRFIGPRPVGFGSNGGTDLALPQSGKIQGLNTFQQPPVVRKGTKGIHVAGSPGGFDYAQQRIKKLTLDLGTVRNQSEQLAAGTIIWLYRVFNQADGTPNTTAFLSIQIGGLDADPLVWYGGNGIEGVPFSRVYITNTAQAGISAELAYFSDTSEKPVRFF